MWPYCLLPLRTSYFLSRWKPGDLSHLPITITYHACIQTHIFCPPSCYAQKWVLLLPGPSPPLGAASSLLSFTQGFCFISLFLQHWQFPHLCRIILIYITVCFISHLSCWPISLPSLIAKLFKRVIMCFISHTTLLFSHSVVSDCLWSHGLWHTRLPSPLPTPRVSSNSCPLSQWCHPTVSSSVVLFSQLQSCPASQSFASQFFTSGGQSVEMSASASVLPMNIQDWFPLGWTGRISLLSKGLSRVFSNATVQKHQFFGTQLSL